MIYAKFENAYARIAPSLTAIVPGQLLGSRFLEYQRFFPFLMTMVNLNSRS